MSASGDGLNSNDATFVIGVLSHIKSDGKIDWEGVATGNGIGYARNATARFNRIALPFGFKYENGKVVKIDGSTAGTAAGLKTPRKKATKNAAHDSTTPTSAKKRKVTESSVDSVESTISGDED